MKKKPKYGSEILSNAYEKLLTGDKITYEEFVIMLATNDELYFVHEGMEYLFEHTSENVVSVCVTKLEDNSIILVRNEPYRSIIDALCNFRIDGKTIYEIWPDIHFTKWK